MDDSQEMRSTLRSVSLTGRELEVLQLKAKRRTNAEIAEQLFISLSTVKWHVSQIYNKLGANKRGEAVAAARQLGLLVQKKGHARSPHADLPKPYTPFIGRKKETKALVAALTDPDSRLVTVTGPGGIGKTRLAIFVVELLGDRFADGICWVTFSGEDETEFIFATTVDFVASTTASALDLPLRADVDSSQLLQAFLHDREILIVFDAFEHVLSAAPLIIDLLAGASGCRFLITSRERLNLRGETLVTVQGLSYSKETAEDIATADAAHLFLQAAARVSNHDYTGPSALAVIGRICSRLEGIPLAIELAADWTRLLPLEEIEQELARGLGFLDVGTTGMGAVTESSWNRLDDDQQTSFARLAVFERDFTRDAAQQIAGTTLQTLAILFDKSLLKRTREGRYTMHDILRQFAAGKLALRGELEMMRDAHCAYFADLAAGQMEALFRGDHTKILADLDNLRRAWRWAVKRPRLDDLRKMLFPMDWFYDLRAYYAEGEAAMRLAVDALKMPEPDGLQGIVYGKALVGMGLKQARLSGNDSAAPTIRMGIEILRGLDASADLAWPMILAAFNDGVVSDPQLREQYCLESLEIFEGEGNSYGIAFSLAMLGAHYRRLGRYEEAKLRIEQSLAISRSLGDREGTAHALRHLGRLNLHQGHYDAACQNFREEYELWSTLSLPRLAAEALSFRGEAALAAGNWQESEAMLLAGLAGFEEVGDKGNALASLLDLAHLALQRGQVKKGLDLLQEAQPGLPQWQDSEERARWWRLWGHFQIAEGDLDSARNSFERALEYSLQGGSTPLLESLLDFADLFHNQLTEETAARLLGFVQAQSGLPAVIIERRIEPLRYALVANLGDQLASRLFDEGALLDRQAIIEFAVNQ